MSIRLLKRWCFLIIVASGVLRAQTVSSTNEKVRIDGFVTAVDSSAEFEVGPIHVVFDSSTHCKLEHTVLASPPPRLFTLHELGRTGPSITKGINPGKRPTAHDLSPKSCIALTPTLFARVRIRGQHERASSNILATEIIEYAAELDNHLQSSATLEDGVVLEEGIATDEQDHGNSIWVDGYPMEISSATTKQVLPDDSVLSFHFKMNKVRPHILPKADPPKAVGTLEAPQANDILVYKAHDDRSGSVIVDRMEYWPNHIDRTEAKFRGMFAPLIIPADYVNHVPGTVRYDGAADIAIIPNQAIQEWVQSLATKLVPRYQLQLGEADRSKLRFRTFVVEDFPATLGSFFVEEHGLMPNYQIVKYEDRFCKAFYSQPKAGEMVPNVVASPDGTLLVPVSQLTSLGNTAQLAVALSTAITSVIQKQQLHARPRQFLNWLQIGPYEQKGDPWTVGSWQSTQALRVGIRQAFLAGFDIREAPSAWAAMQGMQFTNPVVKGSHDAHVPWFVSYSFVYLNAYYKDVDYSKLKRGEAEYQQFLAELRKADPEAFTDGAPQGKQ